MDGSNCLFENPFFENPTQNEFSLLSNSSAINAGLDASCNNINLGTNNHVYTSPSSVVISAIHYHPKDNVEEEFIKIYNPSEFMISMDNYALIEGIDFIFPSDVSIAPDETIYLVKDISLYPDLSEQTFQWTSGKLSNDGEQLIMTDSYGIIVDHVTYNDQLPWSILADGEGYYLELINADLDNHFGENWEAINLNPTSVEDVIDDFNFVLSPNPSSDIIEIKSSTDIIKDIEIIDSSGRKLWNDNPNKESVYIDLRRFVEGIYFVKVNGSHLRKVVFIK